jgi:hypothetical protein
LRHVAPDMRDLDHSTLVASRTASPRRSDDAVFFNEAGISAVVRDRRAAGIEGMTRLAVHPGDDGQSPAECHQACAWACAAR